MNKSLYIANSNNFKNNDDINFNDFNTMSLSYEQILEWLEFGNPQEKQLAAIELEFVKNSDDAFILTKNLVGQDGKIREAVSYKINELVLNKEFQKYFLKEKFFRIFLDAIMDINGNVCRNIVPLTNIPEFKKYLSSNLVKEIFSILEKIKNLSADEKQYKISKRNFQLYWSLEALYNILDEVDERNLEQILNEISIFEDYTIREKAAKILAKINKFPEISGMLKKDKNYYVRRFL